MLRYRLISNINGKWIYDYSPDDSDDHGEVVYDEKNKSYEITRLASSDKFNLYANKLLYKIKKAIENDSPLTEGIIAWY